MFVSQCNPKHSQNPSWTPIHLNCSRSPFLSSVEGQNEQKQIKNNKQKDWDHNVICHMSQMCDRWHVLQKTMVLGGFLMPNSISVMASFRFSQDQCRQRHHTKHPLEFLNDRRCCQAPWKLLWPCQHQPPRLIQFHHYVCTVKRFCPQTTFFACSVVGSALETV